MNEDELREILYRYAIGFELIELRTHDKIHAYPTKRPHVYKIELVLRTKLEKCDAEEILKHLLTKDEFDDWRAKK